MQNTKWNYLMISIYLFKNIYYIHLKMGTDKKIKIKFFFHLRVFIKWCIITHWRFNHWPRTIDGMGRWTSRSWCPPISRWCISHIWRTFIIAACTWRWCINTRGFLSRIHCKRVIWCTRIRGWASWGFCRMMCWWIITIFIVLWWSRWVISIWWSTWSGWWSITTWSTCISFSINIVTMIVIPEIMKSIQFLQHE